MLNFYGYKKCDTCRRAEKYLNEKKIEYKFIDITEKPPAAAQLKKILSASGHEIKALYNTSGQEYRRLKFKEKAAAMSEAEIFKTLAGNGRLLKRPLVVEGAKATIGFKDDFKKIWK